MLVMEKPVWRKSVMTSRKKAEKRKREAYGETPWHLLEGTILRHASGGLLHRRQQVLSAGKSPTGRARQLKDKFYTQRGLAGETAKLNHIFRKNILNKKDGP